MPLKAARLHAQVLVEGPNPKDPMQAMGRTRHNKLAFFPTTVPASMLKGQLVSVHIDEVRAYSLFGRMLEPTAAALLGMSVMPALQAA